MRLAKSVAEAMARDIEKARRKVLRRATPEETYQLMRLADDLKNMAMDSWLSSLAERYERGQHHLADHFEFDDPEEVERQAQDMARDLREMRQKYSEHQLGDEVTFERSRTAEELLAKHGEKVVLSERARGEHDLNMN